MNSTDTFSEHYCKSITTPINMYGNIPMKALWNIEILENMILFRRFSFTMNSDENIACELCSFKISLRSPR